MSDTKFSSLPNEEDVTSIQLTDKPQDQENNNLIIKENEQDNQKDQIDVCIDQLQMPQEIQNIDYEIQCVSIKLTSGNFEPAIFLMNRKILQPDWVDMQGYGVIHYAVVFGRRDILLLLIQHFNINPDTMSSLGQSPLMLAANFGEIDQLKMIVSTGKTDVNRRDSDGFSALLYCVKANAIACFLYLLNNGADINVCDSNGCGVVHWAAYQNNLWFLRLFKRAGLTMSQTDTSGMMPIQRAIQSQAHQSIYWFIEQNLFLCTKIDTSNIKSKAIVHRVKQYQREYEIQNGVYKKIYIFEIIFYKFFEFLKKYPKYGVFGIYSFITMTYLLNFCYSILSLESEQYPIQSILTLILAINYLSLIYWFIFKENSQEQVQPKKVYSSLQYEALVENQQQTIDIYNSIQGISIIDKNKLNVTNFDSLNNLFDNLGQGTYTFIHIICFLINSSRFSSILNLDFNRYCTTCLNYKEPKTKHCKETNKCVENFNHYSYVFGKSINHMNHFPYYVILISQQISLYAYLHLQRQIFEEFITAESYFCTILEVGLLILFNQGIISLFLYILTYIFLFYNTLLIGVETQGILINNTYNEIINRQRYGYLFSMVYDEKDQLWTKYNNESSLGIKGNLKNYYHKCIKRIRI